MCRSEKKLFFFVMCYKEIFKKWFVRLVIYVRDMFIDFFLKNIVKRGKKNFLIFCFNIIL